MLLTENEFGKTESKRILVAEDNAALARVVQFNMERAGYDVTVAPNGQIALDHVTRQQFDLIITDQQMPVMTGIDLCEKARYVAGYASVPVILLTAKGLELDLPRLQEELGIAAVSAKPFSPLDLVQTVDSLLNAATY